MNGVWTDWRQWAWSIGLAALTFGGLRVLPRLLAGVPFVPPKTVKARMDAGDDMLVLDVRTPGEYAAGGHVPGALNLPLDRLGGRLDAAGADLQAYMETPVYVYCQTSNRSASAARSLKKAGFTQVRVMAGGMGRWLREGLPRSS
jgi:rhodanese-related sulfurtransferase